MVFGYSLLVAVRGRTLQTPGSIYIIGTENQVKVGTAHEYGPMDSVSARIGQTSKVAKSGHT